MPQEYPTTIYHYCGVDGFLGIVRNRELWLTHCRFMNDYAEHIGMLTQAHEYLQGLTLYGPQDEFRNALEHLSGLVQQSPYLACFSSEGDLLSQWRAYANDGAGFAIGFSKDAIKRQCDDGGKAAGVGVSLQQVSYDASQSSDRLRATIQSYLTHPNVADWRKNTLVGLCAPIFGRWRRYAKTGDSARNVSGVSSCLLKSQWTKNMGRLPTVASRKDAFALAETGSCRTLYWDFPRLPSRRSAWDQRLRMNKKRRKRFESSSEPTDTTWARLK